MTNTNLVDCNTGRGINDLSLQPEGTGGFLHDVHRSLGVGNIGWVNEYGNANSLRNHVVQEPQSLCFYLADKKIDACRIAARPSEVGDKTKPDRVFTNAENDRDRRGRSFGRKRSRGTAGNGDQSRPPVGGPSQRKLLAGDRIGPLASDTRPSRFGLPRSPFH